MVSENINCQLRMFKNHDSKLYENMGDAEHRFKSNLVSAPATKPTIDQRLFDHGYLMGFDASLILVEEYGASMNDPAALILVAGVLARLEKVDLRGQLSGRGRIITLRSRKFVI